MLGLGLSIPQLAVRGLRLTDPGTAIRSLFTAGEQGVWYDPSDLTTLFQDAAGTIPVTAVEQPVGLMLDKSKNGVGTNGAKRVNLLLRSEEFDNAAWTKLRTTVVANGFAGPDGASTADKLVEDTTTGSHITVQGAAVTAGAAYTFSFFLRASERVSVLASMSVSFPANSDCVFDASTGVATNVAATSVSMVPVGNGWYRCSVTATANATGAGNMNLYLRSGTSISYTGNGTSGIYIWGADLRLASEASTLPTYQKITDTWYNTLPGNHAFQSTSTDRPVLSGRYNLLTKTEQFDDGYWTKANATISANAAVAPDGTATADLLTEGTANTEHRCYRVPTSYVPTLSYTVSISVKPNGRTKGLLGFYDGGSGSFFGCKFDTATLSATNYTLLNAVVESVSITPEKNGFYRVTATGKVNDGGTSGVFYIAPCDSFGNQSYLGDGASGIYIWGADLRVTNDGVGLPAYQRVNTSTDYDTAGFPLYLSFNGSNQWMQTNSIDFTGTDKMTVFAGARKLSDAGSGYIAELGFGGTGKFELLTPYGAATNVGIALTGSTSTSVAIVTGKAAPITSVITGKLDLSTATPALQNIVRYNGADAATGAVNAGTGTFSNLALNIGRRANVSGYLNGRLYSMVVRGAQSTAQQITDAETYVNSKTKAYA